MTLSPPPDSQGMAAPTALGLREGPLLALAVAIVLGGYGYPQRQIDRSGARPRSRSSYYQLLTEALLSGQDVP